MIDGVDGAAHDDQGTPAHPVDPDRPSVYRIVDHLTGGKDSFEVDRHTIETFGALKPAVAQVGPDVQNAVRRAVHWLVTEAGIRQIIEIGTLQPDADGSIHQTVRASHPDTRIVYTSGDPQVVAHGRALLADEVTTTMIEAGVEDADTIFDHERTNALLDLDRPFAVIITIALQYVIDDDAARAAAARIRARLRPGCYLFIVNLVDDDDPVLPELYELTVKMGIPTKFRPWPDLRNFFEGLEMVEPGLVYANEWHPDNRTVDSDATTLLSAGMARMP